MATLAVFERKVVRIGLRGLKVRIPKEVVAAWKAEAGAPILVSVRGALMEAEPVPEQGKNTYKLFGTDGAYNLMLPAKWTERAGVRYGDILRISWNGEKMKIEKR